MAKIAVVLACFALTAYGQQKETSFKQRQGSPLSDSQALEALASLLVAHDPSASFSPSSPGSSVSAGAAVPDVLAPRVPEPEMKAGGHQVTYRGTRMKRIKVSGFRARRTMMQSATTSSDLVIVGAGVLGQLVAKKWQEVSGAGTVTGVTRSMDNERTAALLKEGITVRLRADLGIDGDTAPATRYPNVLFCASPSGNDDYPGEVAKSLKLWNSSAGGRFVFTSSAGVFAETGGGVVTEGSPVGDSARAAKLLAAEKAVIAAGGTVLRLAGLYLLHRGAHNYWLKIEEVKQPAEGLINQIHYEDAASISVAALLRGPPGTILIGVDDAPLTRLQICEEAIRAPPFAGRTIPKFTGAAGDQGKVLDNKYTRQVLHWAPRYRTFGAFIDSVIAGDAE